MTPAHRVYRRHPARYGHHLPQGWHVPQPRPKPPARPHSPARRGKRPRGPWPRCRRQRRLRLALLFLALAGLVWALTQAPTLFPFTARHHGNPYLLLLTVLPLVVFSGLKTAWLSQMLGRAWPPHAADE